MWRNLKLPFEIMFFHRGWFYEDPVTIREITSQGVSDVAFDPDAFDYGQNKIDRGEIKGMGFAGFRVHFPVNTPAYKDEVLVFLGASYFRGLGQGQRFGLSARGLAIDTAENSGEEFPRFVEFWIERPGATAKELTIYALLDSPRATGAYRFVLAAGQRRRSLDVDAKLFLRKNVAKLGLAPLTSMFFFGGNQRPGRDDYRPEVHDSDGLSIREAGGGWVWRPLVNPKRLLVTSFALSDPGGFGLMQRGRSFERYQDLEARYDLRPSAWVEPKGSWGPGPRRAGADSRARRDQRQRRRLLGARRAAEARRTLRLWLSRAVAEGSRGSAADGVGARDAPRPWLHEGRRRQHRAARRFRGRRAQPDAAERAVDAAVWLDSNGEVLETTRAAQRGDRRLAVRRALPPSRQGETRGAAGAPGPRQGDPDGDVELHSPAGLRKPGDRAGDGAPHGRTPMAPEGWQRALSAPRRSGRRRAGGFARRRRPRDCC